MKRLNWYVLLSLLLILISAFLYFVHYAIFRNAYHIFLYLIGDIAFVPIEVLIVTLIINRLLSEREKRARMKKLNMVIGTFFSEVGIVLVKSLSDFDLTFDEIKKDLDVKNNWSEKRFSEISRHLRNYNCKIDSQKSSLKDLQDFLITERNFMLLLLENQNLLEHESLTELLWAVFHLLEELEAREDFNNLPDTDYNHLSEDIKRAYTLLISEWLSYMQHLKSDYPYLFSLASRINPFNPNLSPIVRSS